MIRWCKSIDELQHAEKAARLYELRVEASFQASLPVLFVRPCRVGYQLGLFEVRVLSHLPSDRVAVEPWHIDVKDGDMREEIMSQAERLEPVVSDPNVPPVSFEEPRQEIGKVMLVIRNENSERSAFHFRLLPSSGVPDRGSSRCIGQHTAGRL
jgi:hypothetical protein